MSFIIIIVVVVINIVWTWLFERTAKIFSLCLVELMTFNDQCAENPLCQGLHLPNRNISRTHNMYSNIYEYSKYWLKCDS